MNTSAMIETAIVGRGVHVLLTRRYQDTQEGLPHFAHLRSSGGGLIETTRKERATQRDWPGRCAGEDRDIVAERSRRFLEAFVRPQGLDRPSTPLMVDQLEALARLSPPPIAAPRPAGEQLQAVIETLEPIFGLPRARSAAAANELAPTDGEDRRQGRVTADVGTTPEANQGDRREKRPEAVAQAGARRNMSGSDPAAAVTRSAPSRRGGPLALSHRRLRTPEVVAGVPDRRLGVGASEHRRRGGPRRLRDVHEAEQRAGRREESAGLGGSGRGASRVLRVEPAGELPDLRELSFLAGSERHTYCASPDGAR